MTNEELRTDRHPTDEMDGTPAFEASLRAPGETVRTQADADADTGVDFEADTDADGVLPGQSRAGYDVDAVSGDTDAVRPR